MMKKVVAAISLSLAMAAPCFAQDGVDHGSWDALLRAHVKDGNVDYQAIQASPGRLDHYLSLVAAARMDSSASRPERLAFWINAYNACVVKGVLDHYPLTSVKKVRGFFDGIRYRVAGEALTLNELEARARAEGGAWVHFALVCASSSCPFLRNEAYVPERVSQQLDEQATRFLADPTRGLRIEPPTLWASKIFKWYAKDFVPQGPLTAASLWAAISSYITVEGLPPITDMQLKFMEYDWSLNAQHK